MLKVIKKPNYRYSLCECLEYSKHLGMFDSLEEAINARKEAEISEGYNSSTGATM